jgi:hypothetical protein
MKLILNILPVILLLFAFLTRRFGGKKELLKMDLVQFVYAFVIAPAIIIWVKTVVFFNLNKELGVSLDIEDTFVIDTVLTIISLYIFSFIVIHSLTKSFEIKKTQDPLFDIFNHSEYFHLWLSHIITYSGGLLIMLFLAELNLFFPLILISSRPGLYLAIFVGIALGLLFYYAMWTYRVKEQNKFNRVIKFQVYIYTLLILTSYLVMQPNYSISYAMFWCSAFFFLTTAISSQTLGRRYREHKLL